MRSAPQDALVLAADACTGRQCLLRMAALPTLAEPDRTAHVYASGVALHRVCVCIPAPLEFCYSRVRRGGSPRHSGRRS